MPVGGVEPQATLNMALSLCKSYLPALKDVYFSRWDFSIDQESINAGFIRRFNKRSFSKQKPYFNCGSVMSHFKPQLNRTPVLYVYLYACKYLCPF